MVDFIPVGVPVSQVTSAARSQSSRKAIIWSTFVNSSLLLQTCRSPGENRPAARCRVLPLSSSNTAGRGESLACVGCLIHSGSSRISSRAAALAPSSSRPLITPSTSVHRRLRRRGLPSQQSVLVTHRSLTGGHLTGSSGSTTGCCAAQSNDSFLGSRLSCQMRRATQSAKSLPITKHLERGSYMRIADI